MRLCTLRRETKNTALELDSYDRIGMQYYYMGNVERANYYHGRMMEAQREPATSQLRMGRHRSLSKARVRAKRRMPPKYVETLKLQLAKACSGPQSIRPGTAASTIGDGNFGASVQTLLSCCDTPGSRQPSMLRTSTTSQSRRSRKARRVASPQDLPPIEDLSLADLPSLGEIPALGCGRRAMSVCPEVVLYIKHREAKTNPPVAPTAKKTHKPVKLLNVKATLEQWKAKMGSRLARGRSPSVAPNSPVVITHLSPGREVWRPTGEVRIGVMINRIGNDQGDPAGVRRLPRKDQIRGASDALLVISPRCRL